MKKKKKKTDSYFPIFWVGRKRANKHLFLGLTVSAIVVLQVQPENFRQKDNEVRWQHEDDAEKSNGCKVSFTSSRREKVRQINYSYQFVTQHHQMRQMLAKPV